MSASGSSSWCMCLTWLSKGVHKGGSLGSNKGTLGVKTHGTAWRIGVHWGALGCIGVKTHGTAWRIGVHWGALGRIGVHWGALGSKHTALHGACVTPGFQRADLNIAQMFFAVLRKAPKWVVPCVQSNVIWW